MKRKIFKWTRAILLIYGIVGIAIYYLQDYILFKPESKPASESYNFSIPHKEINIRYDSNANLNIVQFTCDTPSKGVVLYFHGNRKNIGWYAKFAPNFTKHGYKVWMLDYPGFGKSTGTLTEQRLYDYAHQLYKLARVNFGKDSIIIYGKSMGTGIAAQLASKRDCRRLILETPYYSMHALATNYFPMYPVKKMIHYRLPTYEYIKEVFAPVSVLHGTDDWTIPYRNAIRLKTVLKPIDEFITIEGGSHNNLNDYPEFKNKLDSLLKK
jgi:uncharacterized protein